jgi:methyl-accepting chemotaxis protein
MNQTAASIDSSSGGAEEAARTAEELAMLARQLQEQVSQFKTGEEAKEPMRVVRNRAA